MSIHEFAARLNGREYGSEMSRAEEAEAKQLGLLVVYGYSDDNIELRGIIDDEVAAYDGTDFRIDAKGLRRSWNDIDCPTEQEAREFFARESLPTVHIRAKWGGERSWTITADVEYAEFLIMEDGEEFCRGIVIDGSKLRPPKDPLSMSNIELAS